MGEPNIDLENTTDLTEDPPPILHAPIRNVFTKFANMLDIRSFMRLAMASKEMYEQCMNDKGIRINIEEKEATVRTINGRRTISLRSFNVPDAHIDKYLDKLRQLMCNVSLKKVVFREVQTDAGTITETRRFLKELGVKEIETSKVYGEFTGREELSFFEDFHLKNIDIRSDLRDDILLFFLQSNFTSFAYSGAIHEDFLVQSSVHVPNLKLTSMEVSSNGLTQILAKIQSGSVKSLILDYDRVRWDDFKCIPTDFDGPLPEERPLLIMDEEHDPRRWFLHCNGAITKCVVDDDFATFCKFDEDGNKIPLALTSKESVHKALAEKSEGKITCLRSHFKSFFDGIPMLDKNHEGVFPEERPLLCIECEEWDFLHYFILNEDDSADDYCLDGYSCCWETYELDDNWPMIPGGLLILKYLLRKRIERPVIDGSFEVATIEWFEFLFNDYETLPHDFRGQLPERRPLVFERVDEEAKNHRVVLCENGSVVQYNLDLETGTVNIESCPPWNIPWTLISSENLTEIALDAPLKKFIYRVDHTMFSNAFKEFESLPFDTSEGLPSDRPVIFDNTEFCDGKVVDKRWIVLEKDDVRECEWKDGMATFSRAASTGYPLRLTKYFVRNIFKGEPASTNLGFLMDRDAINECLPDFEMLDYEYEGPFPQKRPLLFKKTIEEDDHECRKNFMGNSEFICEIVHFCIVFEYERMVHLTWGAEKPRILIINENPDSSNLPKIMKSKDALEHIFQFPCHDQYRGVDWYGTSEDFVSYFESHEVVVFAHDNIPETRPLVLVPPRRSNGTCFYWFLREDGFFLECFDYDSHFRIRLNKSSRIKHHCI